MGRWGDWNALDAAQARADAEGIGPRPEVTPTPRLRVVRDDEALDEPIAAPEPPSEPTDAPPGWRTVQRADGTSTWEPTPPRLGSIDIVRGIRLLAKQLRGTDLRGQDEPEHSDEP